MVTMLQANLLTAVLAVASVIFFVRRCITIVRSYRSSIPWAHWSSGISSLWILYTRYICREIQTIHDAHKRHGPVIRLSPNEISVNSVQGGLLTVYAGGFDKHEWYSNLFDNYGVPNMFSTTESRPHSTRKRMISNIYSKSFVQNSEAMKAKTEVLLLQRLLPRLSAIAQDAKAFDIYPLICASTMDFVTSYLFGLSSSAGFLLDDKKRDAFLRNYTSRHAFNFYPQEIPRLTTALKRIGMRLVPKWVDAANASIESWTLQMCDGAAKASSASKDVPKQEKPEVYQQLKTAMQKSHSKEDIITDEENEEQQRISIASELVDHLAAGFDTSAITLVYFVHEISKRPDIQTALRSELRSLKHPIRMPTGTTTMGSTTADTPELASAKALDSLPLLHATIQETLRLRAAIPGPQPRITPATGCIVGPSGHEHYVPPRTRISAQAHSLHRNAAVFPDPESWRPERWLMMMTTTSDDDDDEEEDETDDAERLREMHRWFWAFGSGGRMCVGSNLAMYQIKYIIAAIYTDWRTVIVDDVDFQQRDMYTAPPTSGRLLVRLEACPAAVTLL